MSEITNTATIRVVGDASDVADGFRPAIEAARDAGQAVSQIGDGAAASARNVETAQQTITASVQRTTTAMAQAGNGAAAPARNIEASQRNIIAAIQRTTLAMEAGGRSTAAYYEALGRQRGVDPNVLEPYIAQLRAVEQAQARATAAANTGSNAMGHVGLSAAQINQELRFLPNRFQSIADSITSGQRPMTILIQQGGELSASFGGVGAAAKAVGGYLLGMINPYTLAVGAVGALSYAYKVGADESDALRRALILSGNAAGTTASQLNNVAHNVAAITGSREGADALAQLVQSTQVTADSLQRYSVLAVDAQRVLGRSIESTVGEFEKLGKTPLQALDEIDDKYHFITASTREQVRALQDQGKMADAARVAQDAYATGVQDQKDKVLATLDSWQKAWLGLKMYASDAANWLVDAAGGREKSDFEKINDLLTERQRLQSNLDQANARGQTQMAAYYQGELDANKQAINLIRDKTKAQADAAQAAADNKKINDAQKQWDKDAEQYLSRQAQLTRDLTKAQNEGAAAHLSQAEIDKRLSDIRKSYSDIFNAGIDSNIAALQRQDQVQTVLSQREIARIQAARALGTISDTDAINATANVELADYDRKAKLLEAELALTKRKANSVKDQADLEGQIAIVAQQRASRELQQQSDLLLVQEKRRQESQALYTQGLVGATAERDGLLASVEAQFQYNQEIGLSQLQLAELKAARLDNAAALKDESAAALEAIDPNSELAKKYRDQAQALRDLGDAQVRGATKSQMIDQWKQAIDQYGQVFQQGFADMLNNGRDGWSSFTKSLVTTFKTSVADQIYKMFARPIIVQLVGSYLGVSGTAIAGEIASQPNAYGVTSASSSPIAAAQAASTLYKAITGGFDKIGSTVANGVDSVLGQFGPGTIGGTGPSAAASMTGTAASYGAGLLGGHYLGNAIAGDYSVNHGQAVTNIASVIGAVVGGPIGGAIGGAIGGLINRAFGHGSTEVQSQGLQGTLSATSLTGGSYQNLHQDGGWFTSDRNWKDTKALTDQMVAQFTQGLSAIETTSAGFAKSLGVSADWVSTYSKTFDIPLTGDATKDQQAITDFFNGIGDDIAKKLVPNLDDFSKSSETASATLQRLAGDFQATDQVAQYIGKSAAELFGSIGIESAKAREQLLSIAGDASALTQEAAGYAQNFLTDAEKLAPVQQALQAAMDSLGLSSVQTRDQFKKVVDSLDLTTEAGAKEFTSLMGLADAFAQVHPAADDAADAITAAADAFQAMKDAASTLLGDVDSAFTALQNVVAREKTAVQASVDAHTAAVSRLQDLSDALHSTLDSFKSPEQLAIARAQAQVEIGADAAITKGGGTLSDAQIASLKKALTAATQDGSSQFGSYQDYLRDMYRTQNDIAGLAGATDDSLTVEQRALHAAQDQLSALDAVVSNAQAQIDVLKGQSSTLLSIDQAIAALSTAIVGAQANPINAATSAITQAYQAALGRMPDSTGLAYYQQSAANGNSISDIVSSITNSPEAQVQKLYQTLLGRSADAGGLAFYLGTGESVAQIATDIKGSDEYKKLHPFAIGTNFVPETMPALVHQGERIIPAADNRALMARLASPSGNLGALVAEVKALREELRVFKEANTAENRAIAKGAQQAGEIADKWDKTGMPAERTA